MTSSAPSHPFVETVPERVEYIVGLMATREWNRKPPRTRQYELAAAWGVTTSTVRNYSTTAGLISLRDMRPDAHRHGKLALRTLRNICLTWNDRKVLGSKAAATHAAEVLLKAAGLDADAVLSDGSTERAAIHLHIHPTPEAATRVEAEARADAAE